MYEKQQVAVNALLRGYRKEREEGTNLVGKGIASSFTDRPENANTVTNLVRGMAASEFGSNYLQFVNVNTNDLYDAWMRDSANALRATTDVDERLDDKHIVATRKDPNRMSFLEYASNAYGIKTNEKDPMVSSRNPWLGES